MTAEYTPTYVAMMLDAHVQRSLSESGVTDPAKRLLLAIEAFSEAKRWLAEVEAAAKKRERERIALALEAHPRRGGHAMYDLAMTEAAAIARADRIEAGE